MIGKYKIKKQIVGWGFYGEVSISVEISVNEEIIFEEHILKSKDYRTAICFGINFGLQQLKLLDIPQNKYSIRILEMNIFVVDSTPTVLAFTATKALHNALGIDLPYPKLGGTNGEIIFKK